MEVYAVYVICETLLGAVDPRGAYTHGYLSP